MEKKNQLSIECKHSKELESLENKKRSFLKGKHKHYNVARLYLSVFVFLLSHDGWMMMAHIIQKTYSTLHIVPRLSTVVTIRYILFVVCCCFVCSVCHNFVIVVVVAAAAALLFLWWIIVHRLQELNANASG